MHYYCTYFDRNYVPKGLALIESLQKYDSGCHIYVVCLDEECRILLNALNISNVTTIAMHDVEYGNIKLLNCRFNRSPREYYWTLTPTILLYVLNQLKEGQTLIYLDADIYFYNSPNAVFEEMGTASVLIHKHNFAPYLEHLAIHGTYNVGLMGFKNDDEARKVLVWWRDQCINLCKDELIKNTDGIITYGDQKYLDYFYQHTTALAVAKNVGLGVAPWNHTEFDKRCQEDTKQNFLVFYHYHAFFMVDHSVALPTAHAHYLSSPKIVSDFGIPYLEAIERAYTKIYTIFPEYSGGWSKNVVKPQVSILSKTAKVPQLLQKQAGFPVEMLELDATYSTTVTQQFSTPDQIKAYQQQTPTLQTSKELEAILGRYNRWTHKPRLLHLGCNNKSHANWLNVELSSASPAIIACNYLDELPFEDTFFDAVYCPTTNILNPSLLAELFRILKKGGLLRTSLQQTGRAVAPDVLKTIKNIIAAGGFSQNTMCSATTSQIADFASFYTQCYAELAGSQESLYHFEFIKE